MSDEPNQDFDLKKFQKSMDRTHQHYEKRIKILNEHIREIERKAKEENYAGSEVEQLKDDLDRARKAENKVYAELKKSRESLIKAQDALFEKLREIENLKEIIERLKNEKPTKARIQRHAIEQAREQIAAEAQETLLSERIKHEDEIHALKKEHSQKIDKLNRRISAHKVRERKEVAETTPETLADLKRVHRAEKKKLLEGNNRAVKQARNQGYKQGYEEAREKIEESILQKANRDDRPNNPNGKKNEWEEIQSKKSEVRIIEQTGLENELQYHEFWFNAYIDGSMKPFPDRQSADKEAGIARKARVKVIWKDGQLDE
ncbi:MAG: hypothetical protein ABQ298_02425 [Puniceicoccaceae bacterium]